MRLRVATLAVGNQTISSRSLQTATRKPMSITVERLKDEVDEERKGRRAKQKSDLRPVFMLKAQRLSAQNNTVKPQ